MVRHRTDALPLYKTRASVPEEQPLEMSPYAIPSKNYPRRIRLPHLVAQATILQKLLSVQARFWQILTIFSQNDIEGQGQMSLYAIPNEIYPRCI